MRISRGAELSLWGLHFAEKPMRPLQFLPLLGGLALYPVAASAQIGALDISGSAAFVSDYRFRGISLSGRDPAVQAGIMASTRTGYYFGIWGSSIDDHGGANAEIDMYGGWSGPLGPLTATTGVHAYLYPGGDDVNVVEIHGSLSGSLGPAMLTIGANWAPDQSALQRANRYAYGLLTVGIPNTPLTAKASIGHERGSRFIDIRTPTSGKLDYMIGLDARYGKLTLGGAFIGNDVSAKHSLNPDARNRLVVTLKTVF